MNNLRKRKDSLTARVPSFSLPPECSSILSLGTEKKSYQPTRYDYEEWFHDFHIHRPIFLTGVFNKHVGEGWGEKNIERIQKNHRHFFNDLHRRIYKKSKRKLPRVVVIERGGGRFHSHMVIETPEHLSKRQFYQILTASWLKTKHGVYLDFVAGYNKDGLDEYCSKELGNKNKIFSQVDEKNCCKTPTSSYQPQGGVFL